MSELINKINDLFSQLSTNLDKLDKKNETNINLWKIALEKIPGIVAEICPHNLYGTEKNGAILLFCKFNSEDLKIKNKNLENYIYSFHIKQKAIKELSFGDEGIIKECSWLEMYKHILKCATDDGLLFLEEIPNPPNA